MHNSANTISWRRDDLRLPRLPACDVRSTGACEICGAPTGLRARRGRASRYCADHKQLRRCRACDVAIYVRRGAGQTYCSAACVPVAACQHCGALFQRRSGAGGRKFCCKSCCIDAHTEKRRKPSIESLCAVCDAPVIRPARGWCGKYCEKHRNHNPLKTQRSRVRKARKCGISEVESFSDSEIFERDGWRCGICGRRVGRTLKYPDPRSASLDHIVPLACGGAHSRFNVQLAHLICNVKKGDAQLPRVLRVSTAKRVKKISERKSSRTSSANLAALARLPTW